MPKTVFKPSIKSRPVYGELEIRSGKSHLLIADAEGAEAIIKLCREADEPFLDTAHIIYIPKHCTTIHNVALETLGCKQVYIGPSFEAALSRIRRVLSDACNGLQIYLSGSEGLMGLAKREATRLGYPYDAIQTEHRGNKARRMQCVHCKGFTEDVVTDPFECSHCGLTLFVRDHYSKRLAAFQGVCVDAEDPGNIPEKMEIT
jgi:hypothetical protein